jgi:hypothetical protein
MPLLQEIHPENGGIMSMKNEQCQNPQGINVMMLVVLPSIAASLYVVILTIVYIRDQQKKVCILQDIIKDQQIDIEILESILPPQARNRFDEVIRLLKDKDELYRFLLIEHLKREMPGYFDL